MKNKNRQKQKDSELDKIGIEMEDEIKVWNKTEPIKIGEEEESNN